MCWLLFSNISPANILCLNLLYNQNLPYSVYYMMTCMACVALNKRVISIANFPISP